MFCGFLKTGSDMEMKIISYNIHKGFNIFNSRYSMGELSDFFHAHKCDFIFLQEVSGSLRSKHQKRAKDSLSNQLEHFADSLWPHYAYGQNAVYTDGHHGNAILSRLPIMDYKNIDLSLNRWEMRGLLHAQIEVKSQPVHLLCTHLNLSEKDRKKQLSTIWEHIKSIPKNQPIIMGGDFNDWKGLFEKDFVRKSKFLPAFKAPPKTFPSFMPLVPLDRIYVRGLEIVDASVITLKWTEQHSDHLPISCTLKL